MSRFTRLDQSAIASLTTYLGRRPQVLAWTTTADGWAVGLPGAMLLGNGQQWETYPWHKIATGQWDSPTGRLSWLDAVGVRHQVVLESGGRFADLFNERVSASVVVSRRVELSPGRQVTLALRRNLEPGADETAWQVIGTPGVDLADPGVQARIDQELAAAKADFGLA